MQLRKSYKPLSSMTVQRRHFSLDLIYLCPSLDIAWQGSMTPTLLSQVTFNLKVLIEAASIDSLLLPHDFKVEHLMAPMTW